MPTEPLSGVTRTVVLNVELPTALQTGHVEVRRITMEPRTGAGLHVHNGPVFGTIESGSAVYEIEGKAATTLKPGDVFYEPAGIRISRFDATDEGVTFLGYFLLEAGQESELSFPG